MLPKYRAMPCSHDELIKLARRRLTRSPATNGEKALMNMDETKLYSWFLGPKAENADMLERLVLEALRDCVFWRRNFHPEDDIIITEKCKRRTRSRIRRRSSGRNSWRCSPT